MFRYSTLAIASAVALGLTAQAATTLDQTALSIENRADTGAVAPDAEGARVVRAQILLDRARFSPGQIDGHYGGDLGVAVKGFQQAHNLDVDGILGPEMWRELNADRRPLLTTYRVTAADLKGPFTHIPADVQERAKMRWMGYESPEEELGEKFHASPRLLAELNPGKDLKHAGEVLVVPAVERGAARRALRVVVSQSKRTVTAYGAGDRILAQYPATIGGPHDPLPVGSWKITSVVRYPWFNYDPAHFWNASPNEATAKLPPGPRKSGRRGLDGPVDTALRHSWHAGPRTHPARGILWLHPPDELGRV